MTFRIDGSAARHAALESRTSVRDLIQRCRSATDAAEPGAAEGEFSFRQQRGIPYEDSPASSSAVHYSIRLSDGTLSGCLSCDRRSWDIAIVGQFLASYEVLLRAALFNLDLPTDQLEILTEREIAQFAAWNRSGRSYPELRTDRLFERQVVKHANDRALTFDGESLSYLELSSVTNHFASQLREMGVRPGAVVGVCMDRCQEMVIALLSILKAGGAYLPLDPAFPSDRIAFMLDDARPAAVLTQAPLIEALRSSAIPTLTIDAFAIPNDVESNRRAECEADLDDIAYVLYTSGSSGKPKGVQISHRALTNLLVAVTADLAIKSSDVFLATSTISFDISTFEIFAPLISGAHLVVAPRLMATNGELLSAAIRRSGATVLQATPSGWSILLESGWRGQPGLKMLTAGEPLDQALANQLLQRGAELWNLYGPTEATIYATAQRITTLQDTITVGKPLANYTAFVLDHAGKRVPVGAIGELYLGGIGLASGYLNRPELTAAKFIANEFEGEVGSRLYKTGDLARFLPTGEIELLGRADNQIKLRGYRIELEEIERLLDAHPAILRSIVTVTTVGESDQRLIAYVVPKRSHAIDQKELREHAACSLPWYMVPSLFIEVNELVLSLSGKVDRKSLANPQDWKATGRRITPGETLDELQTTVLECWRQVLDLPDLDLDTNFFEVGGHSLLAVRMFADMALKLGWKAPISWLAEVPTARALAERLRNFDKTPSGCIVPMQTKGSLPPIYFIHHLLGDILVYRAIAECFAPDRRVYGIQPPADFLSRPQPYSLVLLASEYVSEILKQQADGPFHLAGYSSGSVLAFEMARQLSEAGYEVGLLALIDGDIKTAGPAVSMSEKHLKTTLRKLCKIVFKFKDEFSHGLGAFVKSRIRHLQLLSRVKHLEKSPISVAGELTLEQALLLTENTYRPEPYSGAALLLRFRDEAWRHGPNPLMGWDGLVEAGIEAIDLPGGHITGMNPDRASNLAGVLKEHLGN